MPRLIDPALKPEARRLRVEENLAGPVIAARLGISNERVYEYCKGITLTRAQMGSHSHNAWTEQDRRRLERLWGASPKLKIREAFPTRTWAAITRQASAMRVLRSPRANVRKKRQIDPLFAELRTLRETQRITRSELAGQLGYCSNLVAQWELGVVRPSWPAFRAWITALKCKLHLEMPRAND